MKIQLSLLFLGLLAGRAAAFQSKVPEPQPEQARAAENSLENMFYGFHAMDAQAVSVMARGKAARIAVSLRLITLIVGVCSLRFLEVAELLSSTGSGRLCSLLPGFWRVGLPVTEDTGVC